MRIPKEVFRAYDIRGVYGTDITDDFAYRLGRALVRFLREQKKIKLRSILVNKDARSVSARLYPKLIEGITDEGVAVFDGGVSTTPMHYFGLGTFDAEAGVMVTPSHGAPGMCGFKISTKTERISGQTGLHEIYEIMRKEIPPPEKKGTVRPLDFLPQYIDFLKKFLSVPSIAPKLHVVFDASGGAAGGVLEKLLPQISIESAKLFFDADPDFRAHDPNPLLPESQKHIKGAIQKSHQDFGVLFDGDGDRVIFFDERAREIPPDYIAALIAGEKLKNHPYQTVVFDVNASRASVSYVESKKGIVERIRVGTAFFRNKLQGSRSILMGAESSGHFYYPEFFNSDAAILTFLYLLNIRASSRKQLSELIAPFMTVARSGEINYDVSDKEGALARAREHFSDGELSIIDGIAVQYPDWRFTLRPSNTDPVIRMHIEANTKELLEEKRKILEKIIYNR